MKVCLSFDIGIYNLAYCKLLIDDDFTDVSIAERAKHVAIKEWCIVSLKPEHEKKTDLYVLAQNLTKELNDRFNHDNCVIDMVYIENQPVQKNPTMKSIQMIVFSYFINQKHLYNNNMLVRLVSASNKLKVFHGNDCPEENANIASAYQRSKKRSVQITRHYLNNVMAENSSVHQTLESSKKKDDLSDCFLQGMYMLEYFKT